MAEIEWTEEAKYWSTTELRTAEFIQAENDLPSNTHLTTWKDSADLRVKHGVSCYENWQAASGAARRLNVGTGRREG
jgi:hypothetical protein